MGPDLLVAPAARLGRPLDAGRQHHAVVRPGLAPLPGASSPTSTSPGRPDLVRGLVPDAPVRHHLPRAAPADPGRHRDRGAARRRRRPTSTTAPRTGSPLPGDDDIRAGRARRSSRGPAPRGSTCRLTSPAARASSRSWSPRPTRRRSAARPTTSRLPRPAAAGGLGLVARGARMVEYWHWHSLHYGAETYWGGILGHSLRAGPRLRGAGRRRRRAQARRRRRSTVCSPRSDVACPGVRREPLGDGVHGAAAGPTPAWMGDQQSYERILAAFYRGLFDAGLAVDVVAPAQLPADPRMVAARWPVLVVPGLYVADDAAARTAPPLRRGRRPPRAHAAHRLRGRGGRRASRGHARRAARGRRRALPGVHEPARARSRSPPPAREADLSGAATGWADGLIPEGATVLARYEHPHLARVRRRHDQPPRRRAGHLRRHRAGPGAVARVSPAGSRRRRSQPDPWRQPPRSR